MSSKFTVRVLPPAPMDFRYDIGKTCILEDPNSMRTGVSEFKEGVSYTPSSLAIVTERLDDP